MARAQFKGLCAHVGTFRHTSLIETNKHRAMTDVQKEIRVHMGTQKMAEIHTQITVRAVPDVPPTHKDKALEFVPNNHRKLVCVSSNLPMRNVFQQIGTLGAILGI